MAESVLGSEVAANLFGRIADLMAAVTATDVLLSEIEPGIGAKPDVMVIPISTKHRILLVSNHRENNESPNKNVDWSRVRRVRIVEIENDE